MSGRIGRNCKRRSNVPVTIQKFKLSRFELPLSRIIGDSRMRFDRMWLGALELLDSHGQVGLGFCASLLSPLPPTRYLQEYFEREQWPHLLGAVPDSLLHRVARPRGGEIRSALFNLGNAIDQAIWDLAAKHADLPLFRYLGGTQPKVLAYASGLCFPLSEEKLHRFYSGAAQLGYRAFKIKVGHQDPSWDARRLNLVTEAVGPGARLMVDANEAWTTNETLRRVRRFEAAGHEIHWVEDPILRTDFVGLRYLRDSLGHAQVNSGEYLDLEAKLALIAAEGVDIVNINDGISDGLRVARACAAKGVPVTLGNTIMNIGAHLAAALPEVDMIEDSQLDWTRIIAEPIPIRDGYFVLSERPGHGLALATDAVREFLTH